MNLRSRSSISIACAALVLFAPRGFASQSDAADPARIDPLYMIQPNDLLTIYVFDEPLLTRQALVRPDGRISVPLVQDLMAAGLSPGELGAQIEAQLSEFVQNANVTVIVDAIQSYRVYVTGLVGSPGELTSEKPISILQAIALAGGFLDFAETDRVIVIRNAGEDSTLFRFNYSEVINGRNFSQNMLLRSGDVVVVP